MKLYGVKKNGKIIQHPDAVQESKRDIVDYFLYNYVDSISDAMFYAGTAEAIAEAKRQGIEIVKVNITELRGAE